MIALAVITEIIIQLQTHVLGATKVIIMQLQILRIRQQVSRLTVNRVIHKMPGSLLHLIMTVSISRYIRVVTEDSGVCVRIAIQVLQISKYSNVLIVMNIQKAVRIRIIPM